MFRHFLTLAMILVVSISGTMALAEDAPLAGIEAKIKSENAIYGYIANTPYVLDVKIYNFSSGEINVTNIDLTWEDANIEAAPEGQMPTSVVKNGTASTAYKLKFPKAVAGKTVVGHIKVKYSFNNKEHQMEAPVEALVLADYEVMMLPQRLILTPTKEPAKVGMSVVSHIDQPLEGKITLTTTPGLHVTPSEFDAKIDPYSLEAFMYSVARDVKCVPGHYAVFVDVAGKSKEWQAVDIPVVAKKIGAVKIDGSLDEWDDAVTISLDCPVKKDGGFSYVNAGKMKVAYDAQNLYLAFLIDEKKHVSGADMLIIGFDPLLNGSAKQSGGYRDDDFELTFGGEDGLAVSQRNGLKKDDTGEVSDTLLVFKREGKTGIFEAAIPWSEFSGFVPAKEATFALSVLVKRENGDLEWGGGISNKDPRLFVPVYLSE